MKLDAINQWLTLIANFGIVAGLAIVFLELNCPSSNKWNRRSILLKESFVPHLHVTRRVADSANDVSRWSSV